MTRTRRHSRRRQQPRRERAWTSAVLGGAITGIVRAIVAWLLDRLG